LPSLHVLFPPCYLPQLGTGTEIYLSSLKADLRVPDKWNSSRAPREDSDVFRRFGSNSNSSLKADLARAYLKFRTKEWIAHHHLPNAHTTALGVAGVALAAMVVKSFYQSTNDYNQLNQTAEVSKRMFEAFEGRANHAELVERALDHDLDK
jgi:hypothetical protein